MVWIIYNKIIFYFLSHYISTYNVYSDIIITIYMVCTNIIKYYFTIQLIKDVRYVSSSRNNASTSYFLFIPIWLKDRMVLIMSHLNRLNNLFYRSYLIGRTTGGFNLNLNHHQRIPWIDPNPSRSKQHESQHL